MPKKNKNVITGTSSLKVKPKKRPGLIKQLSQPFLASSKKSKGQEQVKLTSSAPLRKDELGLFHGYDDMFLPDCNGHSRADSVFFSPEKEIETYMKFDKSPLMIKIPSREEKYSSTDSGYTSPPCPYEIASPTPGSAPAKGILKKKRSVSPDAGRCDSPLCIVGTIVEQNGTFQTAVTQNGHATPTVSVERAMSPVERPMSPLSDSIDNALGFLDDIIEEENCSCKKTVKKSVSFGDIAEVKNFLSDSSDNDICDDFKPIKKNVSFGDVEEIKRQKDECNQSFKKSVSFEDISTSAPIRNPDDDFLTRSVSCEMLPTHDTDSSEDEVEKSEIENDLNTCGCEEVCQFEVEVKVVDIQPVDKVKGEGQSSQGQEDEELGETVREIGSFNIMICHHPGCTKNNENRPMLLCKECDNTIHQRHEYNGHLVLDLPKRKTGQKARFSHANSTPVLPNQPMMSMDVEEAEPDEGIDEGDGPVTMETPEHNTPLSQEQTEMGELEKKLKRKKVVKGKRRHTTGARSHSASDIFAGAAMSDEESHDHRYSYHGSIDEQALSAQQRRPSISSKDALSRVGKGTINHETFTVKIHKDSGQGEDVEIVAAEKNVSLRESIMPILERRGLDINVLNVFVEASKTPLPLTCDTFLLGGTTMYIKQKDGEPSLPCGSQSLSKATGSKLASGTKSHSTKSKSGMSRRESMIGRAQSMLEAPISKQRRSSLQLPFQAFFPSPKLSDNSRSVDEGSGSLRSRRGINLSIDDSQFPMALTTSISPQGTLREVDTRKSKQPSKLTTLFSPLNKEREKQDHMNELLNSYSTNGLPPFPALMQIGQTQFDDDTLRIEADWREIVPNSQLMTKRQHDQQEAIWELLSTELQYIRSIRVISDLFLCVVLNLQTESLLCEIDTDKLFNNISDISAANGAFWSKHLVRVLEESRNTQQPLNPSLMKDGFQKYQELFNPYIAYCSKQKMCTDYTKAQYADNELFKTFVVWAEAQKQCNRLKFTDLLVKPMQRLTKYSLLLQAILRKTDDDHQRRDLLEMIASVDRFVTHVNSTLHQQHEEERLQAIVDKIEAYDAVDAPNDECLKLIQPYNSNFNLTAPMPGCDGSQTRALIMQSPLKMKEYSNRMDVECLLFTDLLLICKASKRMDKYKIVKPPMRVDRIILHELRDKGSFLMIYVNEYHVPVSSFTFHADQNVILIWINHIKKAQGLFGEARLRNSSSDKPSYPQTEIITEEVIGYRNLFGGENDPIPLVQLTRCTSDDTELNQMGEEVSSPINRSKSWNEMALRSNNAGHSDYSPVPMDSEQDSITAANSAFNGDRVSGNGANHVGNHSQVQYTSSDPIQFKYDDNSRPTMSISAGTSESDMSVLPEFVDENMKSKIHQRRQSRTEKRYHTADAITELNKCQNRDNSIYKRFSDRAPEKIQGALKSKTMSSDSIRSFHSSSGVSSTGSLHLSPEGDICEVDSDLELNDELEMYELNEDDPSAHKNSKSKSTPDICSLMQDLNTNDMKDGITSVDLPICDDPQMKLSHAQLLRMKKQLLLSSNVEASEV